LSKIQKKEDEIKEAFVAKVKAKEAELKDAEREVGTGESALNWHCFYRRCQAA